MCSAALINPVRPELVSQLEEVRGSRKNQKLGVPNPALLPSSCVTLGKSFPLRALAPASLGRRRPQASESRAVGHPFRSLISVPTAPLYPLPTEF